MLKLSIFDFDGTLFRSPQNTATNIRLYEKATGIPWLVNDDLAKKLTKKHGTYIGPRKGWFGRKETLEPPLVPDPAPKEWFIEPIVQELHKAKSDPNTQAVLLTGRHAGLKNQVLRIMADGGLCDVHVIQENKPFRQNVDPNLDVWLLGENGPSAKTQKPSETLPWKIWMIRQYMDLLPDLKEIEIWEDRAPHVEGFEVLKLHAAALFGGSFTVNINHVK